MPPVGPPVYGPTGAGTCSHLPTVAVVPRTPLSPTYKAPSGPNARPRGLSSPVAKTLTFADIAAGAGDAIGVALWALVPASIAGERPNSRATSSDTRAARDIGRSFG